MIDIAWSEFLLVGILALILLGPKELPVVLRALGRWVGYIRGIAHNAQLYFESISQLPTPGEKQELESRNQDKDHSELS